eukprot:gb/GEZN01012543.1/.p1 GENE.gb/GEZN01012543.1/~~gb/GEZN01012543.1/.p1  ORF type:complete len:262 (-),score=29.96 gb/GEZN01012543.1/:258-1043(-)
MCLACHRLPLLLILSLCSIRTEAKAVATVCNNQACFQGYNCACECVNGVGVINLLGGCNGCSASACMSTFNPQCGSGVVAAVCRENCQEHEVISDGDCHSLPTTQGNLHYYLTCDKSRYQGSVGVTCDRTTSRAFEGDSRGECYYFDSFNVSFQVNCRAGFHFMTVIGVVLGMLACCAATACVLALQRKKNSGVPFASPSLGDAPSNPHKPLHSSAASTTGNKWYSDSAVVTELGGSNNSLASNRTDGGGQRPISTGYSAL